MSHDPRCFEVKLINVLKYVLTAYIICKKRKGWKKDWNTRLSIMNTKEKEKGQDQQENSNEVSWRERKERHTPQKSCNYNEWAERHLHDVFYGTEARMRSSFFCRWKILSKLRMFLYILFIPIYVISTKVLCWFPLHPYYSLWPKYTNFVRGARMWSKCERLEGRTGRKSFLSSHHKHLNSWLMQRKQLEGRSLMLCLTSSLEKKDVKDKGEKEKKGIKYLLTQLLLVTQNLDNYPIKGDVALIIT